MYAKLTHFCCFVFAQVTIPHGQQGCEAYRFFSNVSQITQPGLKLCTESVLISFKFCASLSVILKSYDETAPRNFRAIVTKNAVTPGIWVALFIIAMNSWPCGLVEGLFCLELQQTVKEITPIKTNPQTYIAYYTNDILIVAVYYYVLCIYSLLCTYGCYFECVRWRLLLFPVNLNNQHSCFDGPYETKKKFNTCPQCQVWKNVYTNTTWCPPIDDVVRFLDLAYSDFLSALLLFWLRIKVCMFCSIKICLGYKPTSWWFLAITKS